MQVQEVDFLAQSPTATALEISSFSTSSPSYFPSPSISHVSIRSTNENLAAKELCKKYSPTSCANSSAVTMPPTTHCRHGATIGTNHLWEPYPVSKTSDGKVSLHKSARSLSTPSGLSALKLPPLSAPVIFPSVNKSTSALTDLGVKEMDCDVVSDLLNRSLSVHGEENAVLLLDMRPSVCYAHSSIKTAVSVNVPNMLLRRPMYTLEMVTEQLTTDREVQAFSRWCQFSNIVLFDTTGTVPIKGTPMFCIAQKLRSEGFTATIGYIKGGYNAFLRHHASFCCSDGGVSLGNKESRKGSLNVPAPLSSKPESKTSPARFRLHLGSLPTIIKPVVGDTVACQTPMVENPNVNPLFESVRQAMGLNTNITEEVPVRQPAGYPMDIVQKRIPTWLLDAIHEETGKRKLAEQFQKVEVREKKRLALLMCPQSMRSGKTADYSISAGIEKGLKNRYNNVWPFDHTRVKILEPKDKGDDYINASFVKSPLNRKLYIATQAPLPSTFLDFWTIVWEQNSRVIVMLTRQIEMGRIKCHQYWPTTQHPVMDLGAFRLLFLEELQPDDTDPTILVRRIQLVNIQSPQEPSRTITQIQYTGWPDFGVPETPLPVLKVIQLANAHNNSQTAAGPMVVHCSAGCGRTGAFCVIDSILAELQSHPDMILPSSNGRASLRNMEPSTDIIFDMVNAFREQRLSMVQCLRQYVFCYEAIFWYLAMELTKGEPTAMSMVHKAAVPQNPSTPHENKPLPSTVAQCQGNASNEELSYFG